MAVRTNLCPNPYLKLTAYGFSSGTRVTGQTGFPRTIGYQDTSDGDNIIAPKGVVSPSTAYIFSAYVKTNYTGSIDVKIDWYHGGTYLSTTTNAGVAVTNGVVSRVSVTGTSPSTATNALMTIASNDNTITMTCFLYEKGSVLDTYFDGDTAKAEWNGWDGLSTSSLDATKVAYVSPTAPLTLGTTGTTFQKRSAQSVTARLFLNASAVTQKRSAVAVTAPLSLGVTVQSGVIYFVTPTAPLTLGASTPGNRYLGVNPTAPLTLGDATQTNKWASVFVTAPLTLNGEEDIERIGGDPQHRTIYPRPPIQHPFRVIAQRILTKEIVDWDLEVGADFEFGRSLSGPSTMKGTFSPEITSIQELGLDPYAHIFHVEIDNEIRASAILMPPEYNESSLSFECTGVSLIPFLHTYEDEFSGIEVDPMDVTRTIWEFVQSQPESNLGITIASTESTVTIGEPERIETETEVDPETEEETVTENVIEAKPYELNWWDAKNCGDEIDSLASQTPFDYRERSRWNASKTDVLYNIDLGFPRLGIQKTDLIFVDGVGENILDVVPVHEDPDAYASAVRVIGAGEGREAIRGYAGERLANRIRKVYTLTDKSITTTVRANARAREELLIRKNMAFSISDITIDAHHPNAPLGSYDAGDDILVRVYVPWLLNDVSAWYRILDWAYQPARDIVRLTLARSDSFRYGSPTT